MYEKVKIKRISKEVKMPSYAHKGDAGLDLFSNSEIDIKQGETKLVPTGVKMQMPKHLEAQIRPKSGLALKHGITVLNTPGTIDSSYRGELKVIVINHGKKPYKVEKGKKIAQMVFQKVRIADIEEVEDLEETRRGEGRFGSTGLD